MRLLSPTSGYQQGEVAQGLSECALTGEADLHEVERVQREVGQDPAAHTRHQILVPDVAEYRAPR